LSGPAHPQSCRVTSFEVLVPIALQRIRGGKRPFRYARAACTARGRVDDGRIILRRQHAGRDVRVAHPGGDGPLHRDPTLAAVATARSNACWPPAAPRAAPHIARGKLLPVVAALFGPTLQLFLQRGQQVQLLVEQHPPALGESSRLSTKAGHPPGGRVNAAIYASFTLSAGVPRAGGGQHRQFTSGNRASTPTFG